MRELLAATLLLGIPLAVLVGLVILADKLLGAR